MEANRLLSDPYAGVFFSKDRVETIIESAEPEDWATIVDGSSAGEQVRLLAAGEWMSGCPEGSECIRASRFTLIKSFLSAHTIDEQSFLFQLYNKLAVDDLECSARCGQAYKRNKADFFAVLVSQRSRPM